MLWCALLCAVLWCGVLWCGVLWCGVLWCGGVWCAVVWCAPQAREIIDLIREVGTALTSANPIELVVGNIVRRVLFIVRQVGGDRRHSGVQWGVRESGDVT